MRDIEKALAREYTAALDKACEFDKSELYALYDRKRKTNVDKHFKKYVTASFAAAALLAAVIAVTAGASKASLRELVNVKTADLAITDDKRSEMTERLAAWKISPEEFERGSFEIGANSFGETFGSLFDGVDLIAVAGYENGEDTTGYVYLADLSEMTFFEVYSDFGIDTGAGSGISGLDWIYVYDSEGVNVVGKYTGSGFYTNSRLENEPELVMNSPNGSSESVLRYMITAQSRSDYKLAYGVPYTDVPAEELDNTYGYLFGDDEVTVVTRYDDNGEVLAGCVYNDDLEKLQSSANALSIMDITEVIGQREYRNWIYVYALDKRTVIGKYFIDYTESGSFGGSEEEFGRIIDDLEKRRAEFSYGFYTNEKLSSGGLDEYIVNGTDADAYEQEALQRQGE